jgi:hypothetical protein
MIISNPMLVTSHYSQSCLPDPFRAEESKETRVLAIAEMDSSPPIHSLDVSR